LSSTILVNCYGNYKILFVDDVVATISRPTNHEKTLGEVKHHFFVLFESLLSALNNNPVYS
jgi:nicotinamidase-related amidase